MDINDMDFFHQATMRICGSLDSDTALSSCFHYLKDFMPANGIYLNVYDPEKCSIQNIAIASDTDLENLESPVMLSKDAMSFIESLKDDPVHIINNPKDHVVGELVWRAMGKPAISFMVLDLIVEEETLGVLVMFAKDFNRYSKEDARLLALLHDPFAVAMSNTLRHKEVLRLKDLLADDNQYLSRQLHHISGDEIIGRNFGLKNVMEMVGQVAPLDSQVLLLGETGVGKEVIANAIHYSSPRTGGPFIKVNCGAIPDNLIDSELFGHEKGAFTGAVARKRGRFERADKGTIFLDEIGELPLQAQVRLLRVIQNHDIERVGGTDPIPVDIRIIAATNRNLQEMVHAGRFREDLWFRLNVFPITIPPLRLRVSDIPALVNHFIERKAREMNFTYLPVPAPGAIEELQTYNWPGNVRELENVVERSLIRNRTALPNVPLEFYDFRQSDRTDAPQIVVKQQNTLLNLDEAMRLHIQAALKISGGKIQGKTGAAALLGINPSTLRNRMIKLGIEYGRKV